MKRYLILGLIALVIVAVGFAVFLHLDKPADFTAGAEFKPFQPELPLKQLLERRFPAEDARPWEEVRNAALADHYREFESSLTDFVVPDVRAQIRRRRATYLKQFSDQYFEIVAGSGNLERVKNSVDVWLNQRTERGEYSNRARVWQLSPMKDLSSDAPVVALIHGELARRNHETDKALKYLEGLDDKLKAANAPVFFQLAAARQYRMVVKNTDKQPEAIQRAEGKLIALAADFLAQQSATDGDDDDQFIWEIILDVHSTLTVDGKIALTSACLQNQNLKDFFLHVLVGETCRDVAWDKRGSGYADTVTTGGWQSFDEYLGIAATHYRLAWALRPDLPFASRRMIMVSHAHGDDWTPRLWFDMTVQAKFDDFDAYDDYLHTLKPRWGGSVQEMLNFGYECARTGDFKSEVANILHHAVGLAAEEVRIQRANVEASNENVSQLLQDPELQRELRSLWAEFDRQLDDGLTISPGRVADAYSWRAACALRMQDAETLAACAPRLRDADTWRGFSELYWDPSEARDAALAYGSEHRDIVHDLERSFGILFNGEASISEMELASKQLAEISPNMDEGGKRWAMTLQSKLTHLTEFYAGRSVHLQFDEMTKWRVYGQIDVETPDTIIVTNWPDQSGPRIQTRTPFPPPYSVVATLEALPGKEVMHSVGIDLGTSRAPGAFAGCFFCALTRTRSAGIFCEQPRLNETYYIPGFDADMMFRLHVWPEHYSAQYNDIRPPIYPHERFRAGRKPIFGGSRIAVSTGSVRISNVSIRRIPSRPDFSTLSQDDKAAFYQSLIDIDAGDVGSRVDLAGIRCVQERWKEAQSVLAPTKRDGLYAFEAWRTSITMLLGMRQYSEAMAAMQQMEKLIPGGDSYRDYQMAWLQATAPDDRLRDGKAALAHAQKLVTNEPSDWRYHMILSAALAETGERDAAETAYVRASELAQNHPDAIAYLTGLEPLRSADGTIRLPKPEDETSN